MSERREDARTQSIPGARHGRLLALALVAVLAPAVQGQPTPPCSADLDWDGSVSGNDLGLLLGSWGHVVAAPTPDIDGNGIVDSQDMGALLGGWGSAGPGDLDGDGTVGGSDLGILMQSWGPRGAEAEADLDGDGVVTGSDLGILLNAWGECVQPAWAEVIEWSPDPAVVQDARFLRGIRRTHLPWRVRDMASGIEMLLVPPGAFQMGCVMLWSGSNYCDSDTLPTFPVTLTKPYYLGRYEVTQAQWTSVTGTNPSYFVNPNSQVSADQVPRRPVEMVSRGMIEAFLATTGLRLPTEAEWEHACRAGTNTPAHSMPGHPNGTDNPALLDGIAWYQSSTNPTTPFTRPVGQKWPNALGFHDMLGNVLELVSDFGEQYRDSWQVDPTGPATSYWSVWRGGNVQVYYPVITPMVRFMRDINFRGIGLGFRAARSP
jgi:formylglycine-generating enzyme required for sulfatase activity